MNTSLVRQHGFQHSVMIGDVEYELDVVHFQYDKEGSEISFGPFVLVVGNGEDVDVEDVVTYDTFLCEYALHRARDLEYAERHLEGVVIRAVCDDMIDDADDRDGDAGMDPQW